MKKTSDVPVKVSERTRERVRLAAAVSGRSQASILDAAMDEYVARHSDEFVLGLKRARAALLEGETEAIAYLLDEDEEAVRRVSGQSQQAGRSEQLDARAVKWLDTGRLLALATRGIGKSSSLTDLTWLRETADPEGKHVVYAREGLDRSTVRIFLFLKALGAPPVALDNPEATLDISWDEYDALPVRLVEDPKDSIAEPQRLLQFAQGLSSSAG